MQDDNLDKMLKCNIFIAISHFNSLFVGNTSSFRKLFSQEKLKSPNKSSFVQNFIGGFDF